MVNGHARQPASHPPLRPKPLTSNAFTAVSRQTSNLLGAATRAPD